MTKNLVRGAILIAISVVLQIALRQIVVFKPVVLVVIGSLINATLLMTIWYSNRVALFLNALAAPIVAIWFNALPTPLLGIPVIFANLAYAFGFYYLYGKTTGNIVTIATATVLRCFTFLGVAMLTLILFHLDTEVMIKLILFLASIQILTASIGAKLALFLKDRLPIKE